MFSTDEVWAVHRIVAEKKMPRTVRFCVVDVLVKL